MKEYSALDKPRILVRGIQLLSDGEWKAFESVWQVFSCTPTVLISAGTVERHLYREASYFDSKAFWSGCLNGNVLLLKKNFVNC